MMAVEVYKPTLTEITSLEVYFGCKIREEFSLTEVNNLLSISKSPLNDLLLSAAAAAHILQRKLYIIFMKIRIVAKNGKTM